MASLKVFKHAKNYYIKDWDRIAGKQIHLNTGIQHKGDTEEASQALLSKAESYLSKYIKNQEGRDETVKLMRKHAENKFSASIGDAISKYLKKKSKSIKVNNRTLADYKRHLSYLSNHFGDNYKLGKVTFVKIESLKDELAEKRTPSGVDGILRGIKAFIRWSYSEYELRNLHKIIWRFNELKVVVEIKKPKKRIVTEEDFKLVLFYVNDQTEFGVLCKIYFQFARATGRTLTEISKGYIDGNIWYYGSKGDDDQSICLEKDLIHKWISIQKHIPKDEDGLVSETDLNRFTNKISLAFTTAIRKTLLHNDIPFLEECGYLPVDLLSIGKSSTSVLAKKLLIRRYAKAYNMTMKDMTEAHKRIALKRIPSFHSLRYFARTKDLSSQ
jgi:hypothetical protein